MRAHPMSAIVEEIAVILGLLLVGGVFAMSEMAVVTARRTRLEHRAEDGDAGARAALELAAHPTSFLSTVQAGITLVVVLAGAFGGAGIAEWLAGRLGDIAWLAPYAKPVAFGIVVVAITYLSLVLGELVPKRIALGNPERIAALVSRPMRVIAKLGAPLVSVLTGSVNLIFRMLGMRVTVDAGVTEQDIRALVEEGAEAGVLEASEHEIVENAFRLGERQVASIMTPRPDVTWVDITGDPDEMRERVAGSGDSRLLVSEREIDNVLGVVYAEDLLACSLANGTLEFPRDLLNALRQPLFVPETMPALRLLEEFRRSQTQVAVVLDEFGGVEGVATLEHLVEALVGDVPLPGEHAEPEIVRQDDGSWLVDGAVALEDLEAALDIDIPEEERRGFHTVAGLVLARLGHMPTVGEKVTTLGHRFEVVAMDGRRIDKVRITSLPAAR